MLPNPALSPAQAYAKSLPELSAIASEQLLTINIDVTTAITTVIGALPRLRPIHAEMQARWRDCDAQQLDRLEQYALALQHAHTLYQATKCERRESLGPLASELAKLRDRLLLAAVSLAKWGLIDGGSLARCKVTRGYRSLAGGVCVIVAVYEGRWAMLAGNTPVTLGELDRAAALALQLLVAVAFGRARRPRSNKPYAFASRPSRCSWRPTTTPDELSGICAGPRAKPSALRRRCMRGGAGAGSPSLEVTLANKVCLSRQVPSNRPRPSVDMSTSVAHWRGKKIGMTT